MNFWETIGYFAIAMFTLIGLATTVVYVVQGHKRINERLQDHDDTKSRFALLTR